ncbi:MAG: tetratricopeptide repeat protein, partial [bacterium]
MTNLAVVSLKQKQYEQAIKSCDEALQVDHRCIKA